MSHLHWHRGQALPALVSENGSHRQEVIGGSVILEADGTHTWRTLYRNRYTAGGGFEDSESFGGGDYLQEGTSVFFLSDAGAPLFDGTLDGTTLTIRSDIPLVYQKIFGQRPTEAFAESDQAGEPPPPPFRQQNGATFSQRLAPGPPTGSVTFALPIVRGSLPESFEELCDSSTLIAEAYVQSVLVPRQGVRNAGTRVLPEGSLPILRFLETDSILQVSQVFKGPESIRQVVISQKGGVLGSYTELPSQYDLLQEGEHYLLFLTDEARNDLPDVRGIPYYAPNGAWTGMFQIDLDGVHVSPDTADEIREQFDGRSSQDMIAEIQRCS